MNDSSYRRAGVARWLAVALASCTVNPPTVCDLTVALGTLRIFSTSTPVPQD